MKEQSLISDFFHEEVILKHAQRLREIAKAEDKEVTKMSLPVWLKEQKSKKSEAYADYMSRYLRKQNDPSKTIYCKDPQLSKQYERKLEAFANQILVCPEVFLCNDNPDSLASEYRDALKNKDYFEKVKVKPTGKNENQQKQKKRKKEEIKEIVKEKSQEELQQKEEEHFKPAKQKPEKKK